MKLMILSSLSIKDSQIISIVSVKYAPVEKSVALGHSDGGREDEVAQSSEILKMVPSCSPWPQKMKALVVGGKITI